MALTSRDVERAVEDAHDALFEKLDDKRQSEEKPSDLAKLLNQTFDGLGDSYREWYELGDDPWE
jgi:hypothetical protein